jgi:hypothetical protein
LFSARDAVASDTPASRATSLRLKAVRRSGTAEIVVAQGLISEALPRYASEALPM